MKNTKVSFKLSQQKNVNGEHLIMMLISWGYYTEKDGKKIYKPLAYSTGEKLNPGKYDKKTGTYANWLGHPTYRAKPQFTVINANLNNFHTDALDIIAELKKKDKLTNDNLKDELDRKYNPQKEVPAATLIEYMDQYLVEMVNGTRLTKLEKKRISHGSIKVMRSFMKTFKEFQKHHKKPLDFEDITIPVYDKYIGYLTSVKNYRPNTIGNHVKRLKTIMRAARKEGLHTNVHIDDEDFRVLKVETDQIYLNDAEVYKMFTLDLSHDKKLELIRDVFLAGCYTLQRFSDYSKIKADNIRGNYIHLTQQKTGEKVVVPIKAELQKILSRYDWSLPYVYDTVLNEKIKLIARMAGITQPIVIKELVGGKVIETKSAKCALVSSHTARRSGCTNLYMSGMTTLDIMAISGHKTEKQLLSYIRVSGEEVARKVSTHHWFSKEYTPLKVAK